jgi:hypothetical protein
MKRFAIPIQIACLLVISLSSYAVSMWVGSIQDEVKQMTRQATQTQQAIDLLNTELASLARFDRIQSIGDTQLAMVSPGKGQMFVSITDLMSHAPVADGLAVRPQTPTDTQLIRFDAPKPAPAEAPSALQVIVAQLPAADPAPKPERSGLGESFSAVVDTAVALEASVRP